MSLQNGGIDLTGLINTKGLEEKLDPAIAKMDEIINRLDKLSNSKGKVSLQIDKNDIKDIDALQTSLDKLGTTKSANQKIKYFQSTENALNSVKKAWNNYVTAIKNGNISEDKIFSDSKATAVLRYANAFEALKGDIQSISPEIAEFVQQMRNIDKFTDAKGYNFTVSGFSEAFEELSKLQDLGVSFKGFEPIKEQTIELLSLVKETGSSVQNLGSQINNSLGNGSGFGSMQGAIDEQQEYQEELVQTQKKIEAIALTQEELEKRLSHGKKTYTGTETDIFWGLNIDDNLSDIEKYSQALDLLNQKKKEALSDATMWQNDMATAKNNENISKVDNYQRWMRESLQEYQEYASQIEFIQGRLQEVVRNYTPNADGEYGESIKVLIVLLQNLNEEINKIRISFGSIDDENGLKSLLSSIQEINTYLSTTSSEIKELTTAISGINFNINIGNGNNPIARSMQYGSSARDLISQLKAQKNELEFELSKIFGGDGIQSAFKLFQGTSVLENSGKDFFNIINNINDSSVSLTQQMNSLKDYINLIKEAAHLKGVDLSSVFDRYNTNIEQAVESTQKILTGENEVEDSAKSLLNILGQGNQINLDGVIEQLNTVILKLEEISKLVSNGLNIGQALDMGNNTQEINSDSTSIGGLEQIVDNVTQAINRKNEAFKEEANIVATSTDQEIAELGNLLNWLQTIENQLKEISNIPINIDVNKNVTENVSDANSNSRDTNTTSTSNKVKTVANDAKKAKEEVEETTIEIKQGTTEWNHIAQAAEKYKNILGETYNIVQKIRDVNTDKPKISYQVTGETGNSITLGHDTKLISSTNKVDNSLDQKKQEVTLLKEKQNLYNKLQKQSKQAQEHRNNEVIKEANTLLAQQSSEYEAIYKIKLQEAKLNSDDTNQKQELEIQKKYHQENYLLIEKQLSSYDGIIDNQKKINNLLQIGKTYQDKINVAQAKKNDKAGIVNIDTSNIKEISNITQAYTTLKNTEKEYQKLLGKQDANSLTNNNEIIKLKTITEERNKANEVIRSAKNLTEQEINAQKRYNEEVSKYSNLRSTTANTYNASNLEKVNSLLAETTIKMEKLRNVSSSELYTQAFQNAEEQVAELNKELKDNNDFVTYNNEIKKITNSLEKMQNVIAKIEPYNLEAAKRTMEQYAQSVSDGKAQWISGKDTNGTSVYKWKDQDGAIQKLSMSYDKLTGNIIANSGTQRQNEKATVSLTDSIKSHVKNLAAYLATFVSFYQIWDILRQGISAIIELDTALTEMRKVSDETVSSLKNFQKESFGIADSVGTTAKQIQNSTADWMRLGESLSEATESAKTSNILLNVSEFDSIDEATESLVAMSSAYSDLDKMDIIDKLNEVGNNYAISTDGIATALQKSASALKTAGNDMDEAVALVTAGNAVVQDPDSVGAGLRTISLRLTGTEEAEQTLTDLGEDTEGVITTVSKLRETIMSATAVASNGFKGFDILDENGNYKSTYEILKGISEVYQEIVETDKKTGSNNKNLLLETIAGKNRSNIAASILQNPQLLENAFNSSQNAEGSALEENEKYLDSIEGKLQQFRNSVQEFWYDFISSDSIKKVVDAGTTLINILDDTIGKLGSIKTLVLAIGGAIAIKKVKDGGGRGKMFPLSEYKICLRAS